LSDRQGAATRCAPGTAGRCCVQADGKDPPCVEPAAQEGRPEISFGSGRHPPRSGKQRGGCACLAAGLMTPCPRRAGAGAMRRCYGAGLARTCAMSPVS
jgi:hypothetical protein